MVVKELLKLLKGLPLDATIGVIDFYELRIENSVSIKSNNDIVYDGNGYATTISEIETARKSNKDKICNYYIV